MDEEDHILIQNLSHFYFRPVYTFVNSTHIFDNEDLIASHFPETVLINNGQPINNYSFVDSQTNSLVQLSDVFVGTIGKLFQYLNTHSRQAIEANFTELNPTQQANIDLLIGLMDKSDAENSAFFHHVDTPEEMNKFNVIRELRQREA